MSEDLKEGYVDLAELLCGNKEAEQRRTCSQSTEMSRGGGSSVKREIPDLLSWIHCFGMDAAVVAWKRLDRIPQLLVYHDHVVSDCTLTQASRQNRQSSSDNHRGYRGQSDKNDKTCYSWNDGRCTLPYCQYKMYRRAQGGELYHLRSPEARLSTSEQTSRVRWCLRLVRVIIMLNSQRWPTGPMYRYLVVIYVSSSHSSFFL